ncbi:hypothetical protein ACWDUN_00310 [Mycobacterium sp. NPDC003323]
MSTDSSAVDGVALADSPEAPLQPRPLGPTPAGEDGATTAGGPTMVLLFTAGFITYKVWRFRRRRRSKS